MGTNEKRALSVFKKFAYCGTRARLKIYIGFSKAASQTDEVTPQSKGELPVTKLELGLPASGR